MISTMTRSELKMWKDMYEGSGPGVVLSEPQPDCFKSYRPQPRKILVADDESHIRLAMRNCLEAAGYEVEEARDGREAIHAVIDGKPDLLLLDLAMPNLDGLSALRDLATMYRQVMPRVIILTAWGSITAAEQSEKLGASAFLEKPLVPQVLRAVVSRVLNAPDVSTRQIDDAHHRNHWPESFLG